MARIAGVNIANHQHAEIALQAIFGIGACARKAICAAAKVNSHSKIKDLSESDMEHLREQVAKIHRSKATCGREVSMEHQRADGPRLLSGAPVTARDCRFRGQRTRTNGAHPEGSAQGRCQITAAAPKAAESERGPMAKPPAAPTAQHAFARR